MRDGYYLSTYLHIDSLSSLLRCSRRHDQAVALWRKEENRVELVRYWELERLSGIKKHRVAISDKAVAKAMVQLLLRKLGIEIDEIAEIWGTPGIDTHDDYHSLDEYPNIAYHGIAHLFGTLGYFSHKTDTSQIIGLSVDGGPDSVVQPNAKILDYYPGCFVDRGKVELFPVSSPGRLWGYCSTRYQLREGTLMALFTACTSRADCRLPMLSEMRGFDAGKTARDYVHKVEKYVATEINPRNPTYDPRFTLVENRISAVMKNVHSVSVELMMRNIDSIIERFGVSPTECSLALSGGYALSCITNSLLMQHYGFHDFLAPPCVSDSGMALGIGIYGFRRKSKGEAKFTLDSAFHGEVDALSEDLLQKYSRFISSKTIWSPEQVPIDLERGPVLWFSGRAEIGPRALGGRSILGDPRTMETKAALNAMKGREWWRPVAPMILESAAKDYFENGEHSPYMLRTFRVKERVRHRIPAVVHLDGSARVQTVSDDCPRRVFDVLCACRERWGIPIACNTSLNDRGEPIVNRASEALNFALRKNVNTAYFDEWRLTLHRHSEFEDLEPARRELTDYFSDGCPEHDIQSRNPHSLTHRDLMVYDLLRHRFEGVDLETGRDIRKLQAFTRLHYSEYFAERTDDLVQNRDG